MPVVAKMDTPFFRMSTIVSPTNPAVLRIMDTWATLPPLLIRCGGSKNPGTGTPEYRPLIVHW